MIPKIIHYCWFGRNPKPKLAYKCIKSWKKFCKGYKIVEWNEENFDIASAPLYVQQAYEAKKWAFVTDYVRLYVVYHHGGIYLDTDVEIIREIDDLLSCSAFFGREDEGYINTGLGFGAEQHTSILLDLMSDYNNIPFALPNGEYDTKGCPVRNTNIFLQKGLKKDNSEQVLEGNIKIFPEEYFCPRNYRTGEMNITCNTYSIHHYDASWYSKEKQKEKQKRWKKKQRKAKTKKIRATIKQIGIKILGEKLYKKIRKS